MRYVSTRGTAPVLGFAEAMMTGLARDGGLYVPETVPAFAPEEIASLAGLPYEEAAFRVMRPFTGGAFADAELRGILERAYAGFAHPARAPLAQIAPNHFLLELFHGPTLAFKDFAMQVIGQMMQALLARTGERITIVTATSGDTGSAAMEAFRGLAGVDLFVLYPHGRISEVQRRQMTTPAEANVHAIAIDGTFDDAQARLKEMFADEAFRDGVRLAGVNSINWARVLAQVVYYFTAAVSLGAPYRPVSFTVPTGNFGDIYAGRIAQRMGLPVERLVIATNHNDILDRAIRTGRYAMEGVRPSISPSMDIEVSSNFERALFDACGRDAGAVTALMAELRGGGFRVPQGVLEALREHFASGRCSEAETTATIRRTHARTGEVLCPHTAVGVHVAEDYLGATPMVTLATAHPAKFPDAVAAATGARPVLPPRLADMFDRAERVTRLPNDLGALMDHVRGPYPREDTRVSRLTTLPNGFRIVTEQMPGLKSASVGIWITAGGRHERAEQNGIAHFLEHMAFKGTARRTSLQIAEAIEDVGGYINAYTSREMTAYYARVLEADVPLALDVIGDIVANSVFEPGEIETERGVILQEIGQALDTPDDIIFDWLQEASYPDQPFGRTILGPQERIAAFDASDLRRFVGEHYGPDRMILSAAGAVDHDAIVAQAAAMFGDRRPSDPVVIHPAAFAGTERREVKKLEQAHFALAFDAPGFRAPEVWTAQAYAMAMGGGMSSRLFQKVREERGLCYSIFAQSGAYEDAGQITIYAGTSDREIGDLATLTVDEMKRAADDMSEAEVARARTQMKAGMLMGLESPSSRAERLARLLAIWGRVPDLDEAVAHIDAVDAAGVRAYAGRILRAGSALALYGPVKKAPGAGGDPHAARRLMLGLRPRVRVETERMTLRLPQHTDWRAWADLRQEGAGFLQPWEPVWSDDHLSRRAFTNRVYWSARALKQGTALPMMMFRRADGALIGAITLDNIRRGPSQAATVGYWTGAAHARQGYMREALTALVHHAFSVMDLSRVEAACLPENAASRAVLEKTGFKYEGVAQSYLQIAGRWRNHVLYANLRSDRRGRTGAR